jgi:hypothetical protein
MYYNGLVPKWANTLRLAQEQGKSRSQTEQAAFL